MSGTRVSYEAYDLHKKVQIMIYQWRDNNRGRRPRYLFLSQDAYTLLKEFGMPTEVGPTHFMGTEIAPVGVPGIYASIGGEFIRR